MPSGKAQVVDLFEMAAKRLELVGRARNAGRMMRGSGFPEWAELLDDIVAVIPHRTQQATKITGLCDIPISVKSLMLSQQEAVVDATLGILRGQLLEEVRKL